MQRQGSFRAHFTIFTGDLLALLINTGNKKKQARPFTVSDLLFSMEPATGIAARLRALRPLRRLRRLAHFAGQCSALPQLRARNRVRSLSARKRSEPGAARAPSSSTILWSQRQESNPQPNDYKSFALPLSHAGTLGACARSPYRILKATIRGKSAATFPIGSP